MVPSINMLEDNSIKHQSFVNSQMVKEFYFEEFDLTKSGLHTF